MVMTFVYPTLQLSTGFTHWQQVPARQSVFVMQINSLYKLAYFLPDEMYVPL